MRLHLFAQGSETRKSDRFIAASAATATTATTATNVTNLSYLAALKHACFLKNGRDHVSLARSSLSKGVVFLYPALEIPIGSLSSRFPDC